MDAQFLLKQLPPYQDYWVLINKRQKVKDIVKEVLNAHEEFAGYYDKIALYFDADDIEKICKNLYRFCKKNIQYFEESEKFQTTALPTGILTRGEGDCKHFSSFCGGILDAINRLTGKKIDWWYRFASYDISRRTPHHVFVVVLIDGEEFWIDATPMADIIEPFWQQDAKISTMALYRNIAGVTMENQLQVTSNSLGTVIRVGLMTNGPGNINYTGKEPVILNGMWPKYLGFSDYRDMSGDRTINDIELANLLNDAISKNGGQHRIAPDFVRWVYDNSLRSWNFYFANGVEPNFDGQYWMDKYQKGLPTSGWPTWIITQDGRLTINTDVEMDDYRNAGIHIMTAWAQSLINKFDPSPYPLRPTAVKQFSQNYTGNPGNPNANLFTEQRGTSFLQDIGKAIEDAVNWVKDGILKVIGFIPRNAFLGLVGLNVFHMATDLADSIKAGKWSQIADKWKDLGGNPDKLRNTIEHGAGQPAIEDATQTADVSISGAAVGAVAIAAIIAAATPIILAMLKFLNKDGKLNGAISATQAALQDQYPDVDWGFLDGALTSNGTPVRFIGDPDTGSNTGAMVQSNFVTFLKNNQILVAAGGTVGSYFLLNKKGKKKNYILPAGIGVGIFVLLQALKTSPLSTYSKRTALINYVNGLGEGEDVRIHYTEVFKQMTDEEINLTYEWIFSYIKKGVSLPTSGTLYNEMVLLDQKYQLFGT